MAAGAPASRDEVPVHGIDRESFRRAIESADAAAPAAAGPAAAVAKKGKAGADPTAQLRVKINTLKRIRKELKVYTDEVEKETLKLEEMRAAGHDEHDLKQQRNVLSDSEMMVPDTRRRIQAAVDDLEDFLVRGEDERGEHSDVARELEGEARALIEEALAEIGGGGGGGGAADAVEEDEM